MIGIRRYNIRALERRLLLILVITLTVGTLCSGVAFATSSVDIVDLEGDGTETNPYEITTAEELQAMNHDLESHYVLENDINARSTEEWNNGGGFEPIGDNDQPFRGTFDGQGYTVTGITINRPNDRYVAPFGVNAGTIEDVHFENVDVLAGDRYAGGVAGRNKGEIRLTIVSGEVHNPERLNGGIAGQNTREGAIIQSKADVDIDGEWRSGGLVGTNTRNSRIVESAAKGDVDGVRHVGGLVGLNAAEVRNGYSVADVNGADRSVGALFGSTSSASINAYVSGEVTNDHERTGSVTGDNDEAHTENIYYDDSKATHPTVGRGDPVGTGLEPAQISGPEAVDNMNLDFEETWAPTDEFPIFQWEIETVDLEVAQPEIGEGETTDVSVELTLKDGTTVSATEAAEFHSETAVAAVSDGTLEANAVGQTELTATVGSETDSVTVEVLEPPAIEFVDADLVAPAAVEGSVVEATVSYANDGGPGTETATVAVDGETVATRTVAVDGEDETMATIAWQADTGGAVTVDGDHVGDLSIHEAGTVGLESISLPDSAAAESEYEVELKLTNAADAPLSETVELRIGGEHVADESVTVDAGGSTETIPASHDEQGTATHVVELHDDEAIASMELLEPAEFDLSNLETPDALEAGGSDTVRATVTNTGGGTDEAELELLIDGAVVDTQSVTLDADESETVSFEAAADSSGSDEPGEVTVAAQSPDDALETTVAVEPADGIPGFGGSIAVGAITLVLALFVARRFEQH